MPHQLDKVSLSDLRTMIAEYDSIDYRNISVGDLSKRARAILENIPATIFQMEISALYRARIGGILPFQRTSDLWYPPSQICRLGRMNDAGVSRFYAADIGLTAIGEVRPKEGQFVTLLKVKNKVGDFATVNWFDLGLGADKTGIFKTADLYELERSEYGDENYRKAKFVTKWLERLTTKVVPEDKRDGYKATIAIADLFLSNKKMDGIAYPSVAINHQGTNVVMTAETADQLFRPHEAFQLLVGRTEVHPKTSDEFINLRGIRRSQWIAGNQIIWRPDGVGVTAKDFEAFCRTPTFGYPKW